MALFLDFKTSHCFLTSAFHANNLAALPLLARFGATYGRNMLALRCDHGLCHVWSVAQQGIQLFFRSFQELSVTVQVSAWVVELPTLASFRANVTGHALLRGFVLLLATLGAHKFAMLCVEPFGATAALCDFWVPGGTQGTKHEFQFFFTRQIQNKFDNLIGFVCDLHVT